MIQFFLDLLNKTQRQDAEAKQVAKHLSRCFLYEKTGTDMLYPDVEEKFLRLKRTMKELGLPIKLSCGFRSAKVQDEYYERVPKITNAKGLQSWHQFALAFDVIHERYGWNAPMSFWNTLGEEGKKLGLVWGGDWQMRDYAHFQSGETKRINIKELADYFRQE